MEHEDSKRQFSEEFARRFNEFTQWAIDSRPDKSQPLDLSDFREFRMQMEEIVTGVDSAHHRKSAEPEQGGNQYRQVTPTPWP